MDVLCHDARSRVRLAEEPKHVERRHRKACLLRRQAADKSEVRYFQRTDTNPFGHYNMSLNFVSGLLTLGTAHGTVKSTERITPRRWLSQLLEQSATVWVAANETLRLISRKKQQCDRESSPVNVHSRHNIASISSPNRTDKDHFVRFSDRSAGTRSRKCCHSFLGAP